ncbi:MAG: DUF1963 domain-containing protein [Brachymonas sp.]|nr:DUF1963 domain-containing protein [Brachymonas sp.]
MDTKQLDHPAFAPYKKALLAAAKPTAEIALLPTTELSLRQSKLGGLPYLPVGKDYPRGADGKPLYLLLQINFAEMPPLPDFPAEGILQWFIGSTWAWGANSDRPAEQSAFRICYYPEVLADDAALVRDFSFLPPLDPPAQGLWQKLKRCFVRPPRLPFKQPCAILFEAGVQYPTLNDRTCYLKGEGAPDIHFDNWIDDEFEAFTEAYLEAFAGNGNRVGGYPTFTQDDPRLSAEEMACVQLVQLDSQPPELMMWGDAGIAHLFIHPDDLRRRDFSRVLYTWDCC